MNATIKEMKQVHEKLLARKKELVCDPQFKPKQWASSEISFIDKFLSKMEDMIKETEQIAFDIQHVVHQLEKRFNKSDVESSERKRKARRKIEQKSKAKKRKQTSQLRKTKEIEITSDSDISDDVIDILSDNDILA